MKKLLLIIVLAAMACSNVQAQIAPVFSNHLQYMLDSLCKRYKIKGVSAAVLIPGMGIWKGASGISHDGVPLSADMYLPIGSNTKTFTAAMILKLQEEGKLNIDDTIGKWLQAIPNVSGQITIKQLLNHTSGLYSYTDTSAFSAALNADYTKIWQPEDMLQFIGPPIFAPGTDWEYSNTNFLLAGLIIKKIRNEEFHISAKSMVMAPQNFNNTATIPGETPSATIPHGWSVRASGTRLEDLQATYSWDHNAFMSMAGAAGAIVSTAEDNVKFWDALMTGKIVNTTSLSQLTTCVPVTNGVGYGLGVFRYSGVNGRTGYCHGGTCFGYINENFRDSVNGICITALSNQDSIHNNLLFNYVVVPLHKYLLTLPPTGLQNVTANYDIQVYPNPATSHIQVVTGHIAAGTWVELCDMAGRKVLSTPLSSEREQINVDALQSGLYLLRITNREGLNYIQKIQVTK